MWREDWVLQRRKNNGGSWVGIKQMAGEAAHLPRATHAKVDLTTQRLPRLILIHLTAENK